MNAQNDNLTLLLVLILSQNKPLMREIDPVLTFLEQHKDSFALLESLLSRAAPQADGQPMSGSEKEKRSPLQGIAADEILKEIDAYLSAQT